MSKLASSGTIKTTAQHRPHRVDGQYGRPRMNWPTSPRINVVLHLVWGILKRNDASRSVPRSPIQNAHETPIFAQFGSSASDIVGAPWRRAWGVLSLQDPLDPLQNYINTWAFWPIHPRAAVLPVSPVWPMLRRRLYRPARCQFP